MALLKKIIFFCFFALLVISCKKEAVDSTPPIETPIEEQTEYKIKMDGLFERRTFQNINADNSITSMNPYYATIWFRNHEDNDTAYLKADSVLLNTIPCPFYGWHHFLGNLPYLSELNWHVKGNKDVRTFDYVAKGPIPTFEGYASLPNSLNASKDIEIDFTGLKNTTSMRILIWYGSSCGFVRTYQVTGSTLHYSLPANSLAPLSKDGAIDIELNNDDIQTINGKIYNFRNQNIIRKRITF